MSQHTPGPWHTNTDEMARWPEQVGCCPLVGRPFSIAAGVNNVAAASTAEDALLIAAAPDLLEALREVVSDIDAGCAAVRLDLVAKARAALAKAQGEGK